jgi:hypothetical protein
VGSYPVKGDYTAKHIIDHRQNNDKVRIQRFTFSDNNTSITKLQQWVFFIRKLIATGHSPQ